jgi:hypothetical protein
MHAHAAKESFAYFASSTLNLLERLLAEVGEEVAEDDVI